MSFSPSLAESVTRESKDARQLGHWSKVAGDMGKALAVPDDVW